MSYTHYWSITKPLESDTIWETLRESVGQLIAHSGIPLEVHLTNEFIRLNGLGEDAHETFHLERTLTEFAFCKTARKPYDVVVAATLTLAYTLFLGSMDVRSDGDMKDKEWQNAMKLLTTAFDTEFTFPCEKVEQSYTHKYTLTFAVRGCEYSDGEKVSATEVRDAITNALLNSNDEELINEGIQLEDTYQ